MLQMQNANASPHQTRLPTLANWLLAKLCICGKRNTAAFSGQLLLLLVSGWGGVTDWRVSRLRGSRQINGLAFAALHESLPLLAAGCILTF